MPGGFERHLWLPERLPARRPKVSFNTNLMPAYEASMPEREQALLQAEAHEVEYFDVFGMWCRSGDEAAALAGSENH